MSVSALLVDIDNTVYTYAPCHEMGLLEAWRAWHTGPWSSETEFRECYANARRVVKDRLGRQAAAHSRLLYFKEMIETNHGLSGLDKAVALNEAYWRGFAQCMRPDPGCLDVLGECRRTMPIAWVSNYTTRRQIWKLSLLGLSAISGYLITSEEAGAEKPDPRPVLLAVARLHVAASAAFLVGDSFAEDVMAARACGMSCGWMLRDEQKEALSESVYLIRDWAELRGVLRDRLSN
jgi:FMN phosphatase YigB (HAD superfamily)